MPPDNQQAPQSDPFKQNGSTPTISTNLAQANPQPAVQSNPKPILPVWKRPKVKLAMTVLIFLISILTAYSIGKHGEHVVTRRPTPPPIALPPQAIVVADCVPGLGKQYVIPKDIPNGPIYDVKNSKVIAVEYNYKAVDLFLNPDRLSDTVIPLTKNYQVDHFTSTIGELKSGSLQEAQNVPIHLIMYVVSKAEAQKIKCPGAKSS